MTRLEQVPGPGPLFRVHYLSRVSSSIDRCKLADLFRFPSNCNRYAFVSTNIRKLLTCTENEELESQALVGVTNNCRLRPSIRA
jgi:hypothetical protein